MCCRAKTPAPKPDFAAARKSRGAEDTPKREDPPRTDPRKEPDSKKSTPDQKPGIKTAEKAPPRRTMEPVAATARAAGPAGDRKPLDVADPPPASVTRRPREDESGKV